MHFDREDILAEDWEVEEVAALIPPTRKQLADAMKGLADYGETDLWGREEETVTITRGQLAAAIVAYGESDIRRTLLIGFVAKKLGFKE